MESKMLGVLSVAVLLTVASAMPNTYSSSSPHYHSSLGSLRSCQRTSGGYAVSSEPGVYRHEYTSQSVPSSYRVVETRPVEYYTSSHQSRPVIYESSSHSAASRPVIYESSQSSRPVIYESSSSSHSRPVIYESSSSSHNSRPVIYESSAPASSTASRTYTTYTQYENPSPVRVSYTPAVSTRNTYYTSGSNDGYTRYEYPATNVRYTSGSSGSGGCTRCSKKK